MKFKELKLNSEISFYGKRSVIVAINPPIVIIKRIGDGELIEVKFTDLVFNNSNDITALTKEVSVTDEKKEMPLLEKLSDQERQRVSQRIEIIKPIIDFQKSKGNTIKFMNCFVENHKGYLSENDDVRNLHKKY